MKISVEKSCYMIFENKTKVKTNLNLKINGNSLNNEEKVKFLGIMLDSKLTFSPMVADLKERCNSRLHLIKYLSNRKWGLKPETL
ncbi:RNA-directed DNA polymerase from mobile element jockey-like, partial [Brachionus plicatilis]